MIIEALIWFRQSSYNVRKLNEEERCVLCERASWKERLQACTADALVRGVGA
jgi:hypothetical protein